MSQGHGRQRIGSGEHVIAIDAPHLREWIRAGRARPASALLSRTLACQVDALPWSPTGTSLDWASLEGLAVGVDDPVAVARWLAAVEPGTSEAAFVLFSPEEPGLVCRMVDAVTQVRFLFGPGPGPRFLCGALVVGRDVEPRFDQVIEWDGDRLHARARPQPTVTEDTRRPDAVGSEGGRPR